MQTLGPSKRIQIELDSAKGGGRPAHLLLRVIEGSRWMEDGLLGEVEHL